jgi:hypothetical protein
MGTNSITVKLGLDDVLGELEHARRTGNIGRLALLAYCEVRRWARIAGEQALAEHSSELVVNSPHSTRDEFLSGVDSLIEELQSARSRLD